MDMFRKANIRSEIAAFTLTNALGHGNSAVFDALKSERSGLKYCNFLDIDIPTFIGRIEGLDDFKIKSGLKNYDCRNNRLAQLALEQDDFIPIIHKAIEKYGKDRIGVIVGTSTSGILHTEIAFQHRNPETGTISTALHYRQTHELSSAAEFVREYFQLTGPSLAISTACSSSAKAIASAKRMIESGLCDAVIAGGVDSLCLTTLYGFSSLDLLDHEPCKPADINRNGISIGEGAGFTLLEKKSDHPEKLKYGILGYGESTDAHHMSTPHPDGRGAQLAMLRALERSGLTNKDIDYINLHGTATRSNDSSEDKAVFNLFRNEVPCSSTKGWTGHTLGAAGITEAIICLLCLENQFVPKSLNTIKIDTDFSSTINMQNEKKHIKNVLTNSFGFGGNNASLIIGELTV